MSISARETTTGALPPSPLRRIPHFLIGVVAACLVLFRPLAAFVHYSLTDENATHSLLIPAITVWLLYIERDHIFALVGSDRFLSACFTMAGLASAALAYFGAKRLSTVNQLSLYVLALICFWLAAFAFSFGRGALQRARFALGFLLLAIPIPDFLLERVIYFLQSGSAELSAILFDWSGVPVLRDGFVFHLARVNIEVARECSGIRSSIALLILAILISYLYLDRFWKRALLVVAGLFVMLVKNAVRIVTLTLLATYVDPAFLYGRLHHEGGVVFFLFGLLLLCPLLWLLRRVGASDQEPSLAQKV